VSKKYQGLFKTLSETLDSFVREVGKHNLNDMATGEWNVKDELSHITFWHTYYSQNYASLAKGVKPYVFVGSSVRNKDGVKHLRHISRRELIDKLNKAQNSLFKSIVIKKVPKMSYTVNREYSTDDFLEMIDAHIKRHTIQVRRSKKIR
jgi:hypothetical protein